jgi:hypothetical protein
MMNKKNHPNDRYAVAYMQDGVECWLQTEPTEDKADDACHVVNDHEERNKRYPKFYVVTIR